MPKDRSLPKDVFTSLDELLRMEHFARHFSFQAKRQKVQSVLGGKHASKLRGRGLDFEEVRAYVKGDDIRTIDWKVTARTRQTHTKVFSEEKERPVLIVVDQSKSMFFGSQKRTKSVVAAELAALSAFRILKEGDRVGGVIFTDNGIDIIYPKRNRKNILKFLEQIVHRNHELADSDAGVFEEMLKETMLKVRNIVTHDFLVILISDFHRYATTTIKYIKQLSQHNDIILAKVTDPMENQIPSVRYVGGDGKSQIVIDGRNKKLRERIDTGQSEDLEKFKTEMRKHRIPVLEINTIDKVDQQLKDVFIGLNK